MTSIHAVRVRFGCMWCHLGDMAPFCSGPLIGRQGDGVGERCRLSCLMSYVVISCRECMGCVEGLQLHLTAALRETQGSQAV